MAWGHPQIPLTLLLLLLVSGSWGHFVVPEEIHELVGQTFSVRCHYQPKAGPYVKKTWCRQTSPRKCSRVVTSSKPRTVAKESRHSIWDDPQAGFFNITVTQLTEEDSASYWCGSFNESHNVVTILRNISLVVWTALPTLPTWTTPWLSTSSGVQVPSWAYDCPIWMESWTPTFLLLLWLQGCISGPSAEIVYRRVKHREGDTLSVQCSYKGRRSRTEGKVFCKIRRKKCEPGFIRSWAKGPHYLLRDDIQAKVVHITMEALTRQDSGKYWCMRNTSGVLYPMMGFLLEVSPAPTTEMTPPLTHLANTLKSGIVTTGQVPISGPDAPFTSVVTLFTSGLLTLASGTARPTSVTRPSTATTESRRTTGLQPGTVPPSDTRTFSAGPSSTSTKSRHLSSSSSTTGMCHQLTSIRSQESYLIGLVMVLTFLPAPMVLVVAYGFWKKRHMGSYSVDGDSAKPWMHPPEGPDPPWKPAWFKTT